jgi:outer membrane PBP1 activator LpoA protein
MKFIHPLSTLTLLLAISACVPLPLQRKPAEAPKPPAAAAPAKPAMALPEPAVATPLAPTLSSKEVFDAARGELDAGQADAALARLDSLRPDSLEPGTRLQWHQQRAAAYSLQGDLLNAIRERVAADALLADPPQRRRNQEAIVEALSLLPPERLAGYPVVAGDPLSGWLALGRILSSAEPAEIRRQNLNRWQLDYPTHPLDNAILQAALAPAAPPAIAPVAAPPAPAGESAQPILAVLLPASGGSAAYGEVLRQSINAAQAGDGEQPKPALRFYNSEAGDVLAVYRQALAEGAGAVLGPLRKEQVAALADSGELSKPVLALNRIDAVRDDLYQFGLVPEEEWEQAAEQALQDGKRNALLLVPAKEFGQRMLNHIKSHWQSQGGQVLAIQTYLPGEKDYAQPIKKLLQVDEPGKAAPTPRGDADAIFLVAEARDARMLVSQLRYYGATRLPIYATSSVFAGRPNRALDQDLSGVVFCDAPQLLSDSYAAQRQALPEAVAANGVSARLWAMGADAYRLARRLDSLRGGAGLFAGASGELSLGLDNRIHRQLACARFEDGLPILRGAKPEAPPEQAPH